MATLIQDLRYAVRTLIKTPVFALIAVGTLGIGIGVNTSIFSVLNGMLLRPLPFEAPDQVDILYRTVPARGWNRGSFPYADFNDFRETLTSYSGLAAYGMENFNLSTGKDPVYVNGGEVTANLFGMLGVRPVLGRDFATEEDRPGRDGEVLLSHELWQTHFGGKPDIIGSTVMVNGRPRVVIGVMPPGFKFPFVQKLWVPLAMEHPTVRPSDIYDVIGRRRSGVTLAAADAELHRAVVRLATSYPTTNGGSSGRVAPYHEEIADPGTVVFLLILQGAVTAVLLIACANVANLTLTRAAGRSREVAIRMALGAGRYRLIRQLLAESLVISALGCLLGIGVAFATRSLLMRWVPVEVPYWVRWEINGTALAFTAAIGVVSALVSGLLPALRGTRVELQASLKEGGRGSGGGRQRVRSALVVAELALSLVLLVSAMLLIRSFGHLAQVNPGFDPRGVLTTRVYLAGSRYDSAAARIGFFRDAVSRLKELPGVAGVAASNGVPIGQYQSSSIEIEGQPSKPNEEPVVAFRSVTDDYFSTLGIRLLQGRTFTATDAGGGSAAAGIAVVSSGFAKRFWSDGQAIGRRIRVVGDTSEHWRTVVGVVSETYQGDITEAPDPQVYVPYASAAWHHMAVLLRTTGDPLALTASVRRTLAEVDPDVAPFGVSSLEQVIATSYWNRTFLGNVLTLFAALALVLAAIGVYGVISNGVAQRTQEIGIRMALGARSGQVIGMVVRQGAVLALLGVTLGVGGALLVTDFLTEWLYGVSPHDPVSFAAIGLGLAGVAVVASYFPARRAAGVDPLVALRAE